MPQKPSGLSPSAGSSMAVSAADIMRLVVEGAAGGSVDDIDFAQMSATQMRQLQDAMLAEGTALADADKEDVESGEPEKIRRVLERLRIRNADLHRAVVSRSVAPAEGMPPEGSRGDGQARAEGPAAPALADAPPPRDGVTQTRRPHPPKAPEHASDIPTGEPSFSRGDARRAPLVEGAVARGGASDWGPEPGRMARPEPQKPATFVPGAKALDARPGAPPDPAQRQPGQRQQGDRQAPDGQRQPTPTDRPAPPRGFERLMPTAAVTDPIALKRAAQTLLKQVAAPAAARSVERALGDPRLGRTKPTYALRDGFPPQGRSGNADRHPLMQFAPPALRAVLEQLGVRNLADFLIRVMFPDSRLVLARHVGIPVPSLLVAGMRAEMLDLPVREVRAKAPHIKDILLLARLGVMTVRDLGRLAEVFERFPDRLELLAELVALLQRSSQKFIGRNRITRHDIKEWAVAAHKRGTAIKVAPTDVNAAALSAAEGQSFAESYAPAELAAEGVLAWYLGNRTAAPDAGWEEMVLRLLTLMRFENVRVGDQLYRRTLATLGSERDALIARWEQQEQSRLDDERVRADMERFSEYLVEVGDEASLWMDLLPWQAPDAARADNMICFWVDPVPDAAHLGGDAGAPQSLKAVYICMDMTSGAIAPFGGGIG